MALFYFCTMKNYLFFLILIVTIISCESNSAQNQPISSTVSTAEYFKLLKETKDLQLIDVRTPGEFSEEHLQNSVNINFNDPSFEQKIDQLDKTKPTFIYCLSGGRSGSAMDVFARHGFKTVYNMKGGILQWKGDDYPLAPSTETGDWKGMSKEDFAKQTSGSIPVLVDFKASWCIPCKKLKPILDEIEKEYPGKIKVLAVDIEENKSLAEDMQIKEIPLLCLYQNGVKVKEIKGFAEKATIISEFKISK